MSEHTAENDAPEPANEKPDDREAFCWELGLHLADAMESMGIEDADLSDGRLLADVVYCLGYRVIPPASGDTTGGAR